MREEGLRESEERGLPPDELPELAASDRFDDELEVEDLGEVPLPDENGLAELVEGEHTFDAPHAELHVEPGVVERRPQREPLAPMPGGDNGTPDRGLMFKSEHIVTDPQALEKLPPPIIRSNPFRKIADGLPPNTVVFDSAGLLDTADLGVPAPDEANGQGTKRKRRRGRKGGAMGAADADTAPDVAEVADSAADFAGVDAESEDAAPEEDAPQPREAGAGAEPQASAAAEGKAQAGGRRRGRGRGRGKGGATGAQPAEKPLRETAPRTAAAMPDADEDPWALPGDPNGNVIRPERPQAAKPAKPAKPARGPAPRGGRPRGRAGRRPPGAGRSAPPVA
jgi:hypothetical protein